ncbi:helix-turn-helix domain-containing protein [Xenorhabdus doucetiae]|uniref:helix-turn-helix domain-containing protein n=1 Tax=Xenorhabdus doucetiae TaxID=351671 RepID=UPI0009FC8680|nr:helix-turn-helix domain-containing protein [Xenorhabdus doucetiae]
MKKIVQKTTDKNYARRIMSILWLYQGEPVSQVADKLCCTESSIWHWIRRFRDG